MEIKKICKLYEKELWSLRRIAAFFGTNHHMIKRKLIAGGVEITNVKRFGIPLTEDRKKQIGNQSRGRKAWNKGMRANEEQVRRYIKARMRTQIDLDAYADLARLQFLIRVTSKHFKYLGGSDTVRKSFLDKFYFDSQFNRLYEQWQKSGENKWYFPSLDHKTSKYNGGSWELENLQFITWFANRAKAEMNQEEWDAFRILTNTKSDLF